MYHVLINPASSSGKGLAVWEKVQAELDRRKIAYVPHILMGKNEATTITKQLTTDLTEDIHILALGGDGTLNEILNGIVDFSHTKLSCIRSGSGNDFARNMKLISDPVRSLSHMIDDPEEVLLDYGCVLARDKERTIEKRFLISCGVGYDADVCAEVEQSSWKRRLNKIRLGKLIYLLIGIKQVFSRKNCKAQLLLDDTKEIEIKHLFFVVSMNHEYEGGGVPFCPKADPTDGLFDICLVRDMPKWKILLAIVLVYFRKHYLFTNISRHCCKKIRLKTKDAQWIHTDGETLGMVNDVVWETKCGLRFVQ